MQRNSPCTDSHCSRNCSATGYELSPGTLYPILHSLEVAGYHRHEPRFGRSFGFGISSARRYLRTELRDRPSVRAVSRFTTAHLAKPSTRRRLRGNPEQRGSGRHLGRIDLIDGAWGTRPYNSRPDGLALRKRAQQLVHLALRVIRVWGKAQVAVSHRAQDVLAGEVRLDPIGGDAGMRRAHQAGRF